MRSYGRQSVGALGSLRKPPNRHGPVAPLGTLPLARTEVLGHRCDGLVGCVLRGWCALAGLLRFSSRPVALMPGEFCAGGSEVRCADSRTCRQECSLLSFRRGRRSGRCFSAALTRGPTSSVARSPTLYPPHLSQMALKLHLRSFLPVRRSAISQSAPVRTGTLDYQAR